MTTHRIKNFRDLGDEPYVMEQIAPMTPEQLAQTWLSEREVVHYIATVGYRNLLLALFRTRQQVISLTKTLNADRKDYNHLLAGIIEQIEENDGCDEGKNECARAIGLEWRVERKFEITIPTVTLSEEDANALERMIDDALEEYGQRSCHMDEE